MPLQDYMQILSVDDHLIEPPRVFMDRLPRQHRRDGPAHHRGREGPPRVDLRGTAIPADRSQCGRGKDAKDYGTEPVRYEDMIPGCYDAAARARTWISMGCARRCAIPPFPASPGGCSCRPTITSWPICAFKPGTTSPSTSGAAGPGALHPAGHAAGLGYVVVREGDRAGRGAGRPRYHLPGESGAAGPAVVSHRPLGPRVRGLRGRGTARCACTSAPPVTSLASRPTPHWRCPSRCTAPI